MKKLLLVLVATMGVSLSAMAQDVIVLKNADEVQAKVESVGLQEVIYRKWDNLEGPTYAIAKSDILFVKYANGQKDVFSDQQTSSGRVANWLKTTSNFQQNYDGELEGVAYIDLGWYKVETGFDVGTPTFGVSLGSRISKHLYLGGGISWRNGFSVNKTVEVAHHYTDEECDYISTTWTNQINVTADLKTYLPTNCGLYPRLDFSFGLAISGIYNGYRWSCDTPIEPASKYKCFAGLYTSLGIGFDYHRLSFGVGLQTVFGGGSVREYYDSLPSSSYVSYSGPGAYTGYLRLGYRFGKKK